ncbi:multidrug effflux MFS transporter [Legionella impletisoli]|uniref:Bcr/CflA family efflux transporter n=1 Tax=Legionella impletisoli TaxID=343510 RepID=A0A917JTU5_9GAMM|nr:multidrug effflux MFS transporter [Legionella impletisoli]GGI85683.1 Bcr/CflA family drug resistance efflux transporter [Legionella impletisoli]
MHSSSPIRLTIILAPFVLALALAMDVYVPAIPLLTKLFNVSDNTMLLTLSLFMLTAGLMQLIIGPLSDSFGRKPMTYLVVYLFSLGCILCAASVGPGTLIFGRIIQAIGSCGMLVLGFTIVRDCFKGDESAKVYSYLNGIISFSPMFAPFIGSYLDIYLGWRAIFLSLLIISVFSFIALKFFLRETLPRKNRMPFSLYDTMRQYQRIFINPTFAIYNLATCFGLAYLYLFCALSPYLIIRDLHIPEARYGFYFFYMGVSFFIGSVLCSVIVERIGIYLTCVFGFIITLIGGIWMATWYISSGLTLEGFIYPMLLIGIGGTFSMGAGQGGSMWPFGDHTGTAAALGGTLRFTFSSIIGLMVISDDVASTLPLGLPAIGFSVTGLFLFIVFKAQLLQRAFRLDSSDMVS